MLRSSSEKRQPVLASHGNCIGRASAGVQVVYYYYHYHYYYYYYYYY